MNELALFAGAGGGILGGKLLGWRTICAVESDAYAAAVLAQRQNDGILDPFPIWSDVSTFDGTRWRGRVDVISGGFPCQDISVAGGGDGIGGGKSGLWKEFKRIIREVLPARVEVENAPVLTARGLGVVLGDLAEIGYDAEWGVLGAGDVGAPHKRDRIWIVAALADTNGTQRERDECAERITEERANYSEPCWWENTPQPDGVANGVAFGVDRLKAIGNGQVPAVAAIAYQQLEKRLIGS